MAVLFFIAFTSCEKEADNSKSTSSSPTEGSKSFSVDYNQKKEPFVGIITRFTCGACGQFGHPNLDNVLHDNDNVNGAAFKYLPTDPLHNEQSVAVYTFYPVQGTPTFILGAEGYGNDVSLWKADALADTATNALVKIAMKGTETANRTFDLNVKLVMDQTVDGKSINLALYAIENNIKSPQTDYSSNPTLVEDYIHNHVLRDVAGESVFGKPLSYNNDTLNYTHQFVLNDEVDPNNIYFTAVIWEVDENSLPIDVLNSQSVRR